jgi:hypothetical protein
MSPAVYVFVRVLIRVELVQQTLVNLMSAAEMLGLPERSLRLELAHLRASGAEEAHK